MQLPANGQPLPAVFLDRDGVINDEVGHLTKPDQLRLLPGAAVAINRLNDSGLPVIVVTNQSVIGRGWCIEAEMDQVHDALSKLLAEEGARITQFRYCPHHPTEAIGDYLVDCECRKPKPGMLHQAAQELGLDLAASVMVGDRINDVIAGREAGCQTVLVSTGLGMGERKQLPTAPCQPDHLCDDLGSAVDWILARQPIASDMEPAIERSARPT
jgi:D-glycero-D-manno-heptose 1,7-bisphosphate phosphatase